MANTAALGALVLVTAPATAAPTLTAPDCVGADPPAKTLHAEGAGYFPGAFVSIRYEAPHLGEPRSAALVNADASGAFSVDLVPPTLGSSKVHRRTFTLRALDPQRPEYDAAKAMTEVRVRVTAQPRKATSATAQARYRAYGFTPGERVYAHFTRGDAVRTVSLGRAAAPCGTVDRRMNLVPGRNVQRGSWYVYVDQSRPYSSSTEVQAGTQVLIQRP